MRQNYAGVFDFSHFDVAGVEPIKKAFEKAGVTIVDVEASNRAARRAGYQVKDASFFFGDGQRVVMSLKNDGEGGGDIYQVKLNSRVVPVKSVDNMEKAVAEIAAMAQGNSAAFVKAARRKAARQDVDEGDLDGGAGRRPQTTAVKLEQATAEIADLESQLAEQKVQRDNLAASVDNAKKQHEADMAELERITAENDQMEAA